MYGVAFNYVLCAAERETVMSVIIRHRRGTAQTHSSCIPSHPPAHFPLPPLALTALRRSSGRRGRDECMSLRNHWTTATAPGKRFHPHRYGTATAYIVIYEQCAYWQLREKQRRLLSHRMQSSVSVSEGRNCLVITAVSSGLFYG